MLLCMACRHAVAVIMGWWWQCACKEVELGFADSISQPRQSFLGRQSEICVQRFTSKTIICAVSMRVFLIDIRKLAARKISLNIVDGFHAILESYSCYGEIWICVEDDLHIIAELLTVHRDSHQSLVLYKSFTYLNLLCCHPDHSELKCWHFIKIHLFVRYRNSFLIYSCLAKFYQLP